MNSDDKFLAPSATGLLCLLCLILVHLLVAWLSGSALVSINEVTPRRARLVLGWVTVCERVNPLGM